MHIEAQCTCGEKLEVVGRDENTAMSGHFDIEISVAFYQSTMLNEIISHYLVGYNTTHLPDGVHIEAYSTHQSGFDLAVRLIPN